MTFWLARRVMVRKLKISAPAAPARKEPAMAMTTARGADTAAPVSFS